MAYSIRQNLLIPRGDDAAYVIAFFVDDAQEVAVPLTDLLEIRFRIYSEWGSAPIFEANLTEGIAAFTDSEAKLDIPAATTASLSPEKPHPYDISVVTIDNKIATTQRGHITIDPE